MGPGALWAYKPVLLTYKPCGLVCNTGGLYLDVK